MFLINYIDDKILTNPSNGDPMLDEKYSSISTKNTKKIWKD